MAKALKHFLLFVLLTLFTQIGGIVWILFLPIAAQITRKLGATWKIRILNFSFFLVFYSLVSIFIVPPLAKWQTGRVPLPVFSHPDLKPLNYFYFCFLNHHYVKPTVKASCEKAAEKLAAKFPGTKLYYLDANFPFFDGYPLEPHFTHRHGTTVDIALHWLDKNGKPIYGTPVDLAYGASATPLPGEVDLDEKCHSWNRSIEMKIARHFYNEKNYQLDNERTAALIRLFCEDKSVKKILLEPHLKARLGLQRFDKIRFQGCRAARHDDHFHVIW